MSGDFQGKVALVTGAARGIGFAIARTLGQHGATVVIADIQAQGTTRAVEELSKRGVQARSLIVDLAAPGAATAMVEQVVRDCGRVDVLVNNARAGKRLSLFDETEENWDLAVDVGLKASFFGSQAAIRTMKDAGGGAIVNIASVAGALVTKEAASYHATKAGLLQLTRYLAVAGGPCGVRVNAVLPGLIVQTEHRARYDAPENAAYRRLVGQYQPLGAPGSEDDVAEAVRYLCSPAAKYVSGSCLTLDGGATTQEQFGMLLRSAAPPA